MCYARQCKWEAAFKSMQLQKGGGDVHTAVPADEERRHWEEGNRQRGPGGAAVAKAGEWRKCAREAERGEKVMLLVCWGPS